MMATVETHDLRNGVIGADGEHREEQKSIEVVTGGSIIEAVDGLAVVVLAILGLAGVVPLYMAFIATIVLGVALLFEGWALASRYSKLLSEIGGSFLTATELGGGITAEFLAGAAGVALGILSILGVVPMVLLPAVIIVYGAALLLSSGATARLNSLAVAGPGAHEIARHVCRRAGADRVERCHPGNSSSSRL
jgi:hypothetical protein